MELDASVNVGAAGTMAGIICAARLACTKPQPAEAFGAGPLVETSIGTAGLCRKPKICAGVKDGLASKNNAAMPATCGAAAEVPKKFGKAVLLRHAVTVL